MNLSSRLQKVERKIVPNSVFRPFRAEVGEQIGWRWIDLCFGSDPWLSFTGDDLAFYWSMQPIITKHYISWVKVWRPDLIRGKSEFEVRQFASEVLGYDYLQRLADYEKSLQNEFK